VAFNSGATNLHPSGVRGIYVKDLGTGEVLLASTTASGVPANAAAGSLSLSADGTRVAFTTGASNLDPRDPVADEDVYVKDLVSGRLWLASLSTSGELLSGVFGATVAALSADGRRVAFHSDAAGLHRTTPTRIGDVFVRDLETGQLLLASTNDAGVKGDGQSGEPSLSADGTKVAFRSFAANLDPDMTIRGFSSVYLKDLATGDLSLVSRTSSGTPIPGGGFGISLSADATRVAFASMTRLAHPEDTDSVSHIYVKDIATGALFLASTTKSGVKGNGASCPARLAPGGGTVAFARTRPTSIPQTAIRAPTSTPRSSVRRRHPHPLTTPTCRSPRPARRTRCSPASG
jgi:Tol biopolymer transport system component